MRNTPPYAISSVDSALLLATLLQHEEPMRVTDAAARLGVSVSTAHRLLRTLVHRDFAEQLPDRRYGAGPVLRRGPVRRTSVTRLREVALPHLRHLVDVVGETANLVVLLGAEVRFVATVECDRVLRVGDRTGRSLPAHRAAGGRAMLATMDEADLDGVLRSLSDADSATLARELRAERRQGFAVNDQLTETGLTAVGVAVPVPGRSSRTALSVAAPTARVSRGLLATWAGALDDAAAALARDLGAHQADH